MKRLAELGVRQLFGGARRGQAGLAGLGAALAIVGWLRERRGPKKQLIYKRKLKPGREIRIRFMRGDTSEELSITG